MNYRKLQKTDLEISEISFGCMSLDLSGKNNEKILQNAFDQGINYFDTADLYDKGANEELVGKTLRPIRNQVIIATKVGNEWLPDGSTWRWNASKSYISQAVDKSLKRLQTDYIDIYQLHGGTMEDNHEEIIEAFEELKTLGKIRHYGLSSIRPNVIKSLSEQSNMVSDMLQYSLLDRRPEENVLDVLHSNNVGVMARGALAKGLLADKPAKSYLNHSEEQVNHLQNSLKQLSNEHRNQAQTAVKFVLQHPSVTTAVVGFRTLEQLQGIINLSSCPDLSKEEMQLLSDSSVAHQYDQHRI